MLNNYLQDNYGFDLQSYSSFIHNLPILCYLALVSDKI